MKHTDGSAHVGRRGFLHGLVGAGLAVPLTVGAGLGTSTALADTGSSPNQDAPTYPFEGEHQQGILTPPQKHASFVAFDVTATTRSELQSLFTVLTDRTRFLTAGGTPVDPGLTAPPTDSGVLGPDVPAENLTITLSVGSSLFDDRFGLAGLKPARLRVMDDFANDALDRAVCDGDLLLHLCADNEDTLIHALRDLMKETRGSMQVRWRSDGFTSPSRPTGTPRNLLGFKDGTANPPVGDTPSMAGLVWTQGGVGDEPAWVTGGSYHVVRLIRMLVEFWDRVSLHEQENMIGRRRATGAPLTGTAEFDVPAYDLDPTGDVIQLDAHIRLANPRTAAAANQQMLRRPYNYNSGLDSNGNLNMGLIFSCFNQDLDRQFVAVQKRLADEPLVDYISPFGGGYFFALPGVTGATDYFGRALLA
ncbi:iron uptake transporter deferrochelatase/peroxidase subunit [Subtercola sp. RTI3]|uniref:iron uptake transporter deferrochelatase/peroxidase subunit n=1 Tax=Subtercola sp. RTI3 TaxID=3048639 RepID=UPI002B2356D8|nr:iron uptake transporter deferrochelatase/peroxidase subunit [Subtercola sp. RTI3]MEA9987170.1 iron uptake transporter deferrochelatase/peroxidase subunit [Subtercola sp. RTI3]